MTEEMKQRARGLRKSSTEAEKRIWYFLQNRNLAGYKFHRQYVIGPYIADFICREQKLILEIDGSQHMERRDYDEQRTLYLKACGYQVLRFWNSEVMENITGVLGKVYEVLASQPSPGASRHPLPEGEGSKKFEISI